MLSIAPQPKFSITLEHSFVRQSILGPITLQLNIALQQRASIIHSPSTVHLQSSRLLNPLMIILRGSSAPQLSCAIMISLTIAIPHFYIVVNSIVQTTATTTIVAITIARTT